MTSPTALYLDTFYHIFNRGNNRENIFIEDPNFQFFMQLYSKYIPPIADTMAYCLLRNHFHLFVRIKPAAEILDSLDMCATDKNRLLHSPSRQFSNFFNAYTKVINHTYHRTGSLFQHPFKRIPVFDELHVCRLITYIHQNPQRHGFVNDFREWPYSSYHAQCSNEETSLTGGVVPRFFHDPKEYLKAHSRKLDMDSIKPLLIDDIS